MPRAGPRGRSSSATAPRSCCGAACARSKSTRRAARCGSRWSTAAAPTRRRRWSSGSSRGAADPPRATSASPPPTTSCCARASAERCCCSTPTPRSARARWTLPWRGCARSGGSGWSAEAGDRDGRAGPRLQALLPDPARRPRPLHRARPRRGRLRRAQPVPGDPPGDDEPGEVDAVNGAFMLVRAEAVREVGLLDEGYWLYMEDLDWCHRFWERRLEGLLRAGRRSRCTSRAARAAPGARRARRSPSIAAWAASTAASTPPSTTRSSTPPSTRGSGQTLASLAVTLVRGRAGSTNQDVGQVDHPCGRSTYATCGNGSRGG